MGVGGLGLWGGFDVFVFMMRILLFGGDRFGCGLADGVGCRNCFFLGFFSGLGVFLRWVSS